MISLWGKISHRPHGEGDDLCCVQTDTDHEDAFVAEWAEQFSGKKITLRYWTCSEKATPEEMKRGAVEEALGKVGDVGIVHRYSELTGYLWTDEDFNVGGHDMIARLSGCVGQYLYIEVTEGESP